MNRDRFSEALDKENIGGPYFPHSGLRLNGGFAAFGFNGGEGIGKVPLKPSPVDRLCQVAEDVEAHRIVEVFDVGGEDDDEGAGLSFGKESAGFDAAHAGHFDVEEGDVRLAAVGKEGAGVVERAYLGGGQVPVSEVGKETVFKFCGYTFVIIAQKDTHGRSFREEYRYIVWREKNLVKAEMTKNGRF